MGMLTTSGSVARVIGPIGFAWLYETWGIYLTFSLIAACIFISLLLIIIFYKRFSSDVYGDKNQGVTAVAH